MSAQFQGHNRVEQYFLAMEAKKKPASVPASTTQKQVFELTDAVVYDPGLVHLDLHEGYEVTKCHCGNADCGKIVLCMNVTRGRIIDVFNTLVQSLGDTVVPLFIRHSDAGDIEYSRDPIETTVLLNELDAFENVLLNDGKSHLIVAEHEGETAVQLLPHRMIALQATGKRVREFQQLIESLGFQREKRLDTISDHVYESHTTTVLEHNFAEMLEILGMAESTGDDAFYDDPDDEDQEDNDEYNN